MFLSLCPFLLHFCQFHLVWCFCHSNSKWHGTSLRKEKNVLSVFQAACSLEARNKKSSLTFITFEHLSLLLLVFFSGCHTVNLLVIISCSVHNIFDLVCCSFIIISKIFPPWKDLISLKHSFQTSLPFLLSNKWWLWWEKVHMMEKGRF